MVIGGLNSAIASFVGQNWCKEFNRIELRVAIIIGLYHLNSLFLVFPKSWLDVL